MDKQGDEQEFDYSWDWEKSGILKTDLLSMQQFAPCVGAFAKRNKGQFAIACFTTSANLHSERAWTEYTNRINQVFVLEYETKAIFEAAEKEKRYALLRRVQYKEKPDLTVFIRAMVLEKARRGIPFEVASKEITNNEANREILLSPFFYKDPLRFSWENEIRMVFQGDSQDPDPRFPIFLSNVQPKRVLYNGAISNANLKRLKDACGDIPLVKFSKTGA